MKALRANLAVAIAKLLGVPVKVREDFHRPEWLGLDVGLEPIDAGLFSQSSPPHRAPLQFDDGR
jgi:hypothetical protein